MESIGLGFNSSDEEPEPNGGDHGSGAEILTVNDSALGNKRKSQDNGVDIGKVFSHMNRCMDLFKDMAKSRDALPVEITKQVAEVFATHLNDFGSNKRHKGNHVELEEQPMMLVEENGLSFSDNQHDILGKGKNLISLKCLGVLTVTFQIGRSETS